ncbi:MAG: GNAT family N-acetyltransferase [Pseudomonadota bacterium]
MTEQFTTKRLILRPPVPADAERVAELMSEKDLPWNLGRAPWPYALEDAHAWIQAATEARAANADYPFVVCTPEIGLIGSCGVVPVTEEICELGYWIGKPYWSQGYVTEAAEGVLDWARTELNIDQFVSGHINDNPASGRVLMKLGFSPAGPVTHYVRARDCDVEATRYVLGAPADIAIESAAHYKRPQDAT